ncbi:XRE family transcriptional regulator [Terasakiella sp. A23]|uniref:helix-turn-helix domain-containing protein n=1 Tax=Terasakiella sp. FCG-A23 TaxID=3080561 RepID=UPI00295570A1|nr:XRE family transcriptional regulator [Terasakiella sp. A23]MDV7338103.1 XRE family transcriptional regulator [Terasakiella sp. A23]
MQDPKDHLADMLRSVRKEKKLSLDKAADLTGVSKAMLGQIERGESSPTVSTLWKIATGFEVSLSSFIEPPSKKLGETAVRESDDIRQHPAGEGLLIAPLFPYDDHLGFEYLELTIQSGYNRMSEPHAPGVIEFITIMEGALEIYCDDLWHDLEVGQTIRFAGDRPHGYRNMSDQDAKVLTVIHYPNGR